MDYLRDRGTYRSVVRGTRAPDNVNVAVGAVAALVMKLVPVERSGLLLFVLRFGVAGGGYGG